MEAEEFLFVMNGKSRLKLCASGLWKMDIKKVYPLIELTMKKITNQVIVDGQMKLHNKITGQTILCMNMKEKRILLQNGLGLKELNQRHFAQGGEEGIGDRI